MRYVLLWMVLTTVVCTAHPASADCHHCWSQGHVEYYRNKVWPEPFIYPDREAYWAPWGVMVANGWQRQNTLGHHHFHRETSRLNRAGEAKLRWILIQAPAQRRSVFVLQSPNQQESASRMESVQQAVAGILPNGQAPEVLFTSAPAPNWSGERTNTVNRGFNSNLPQPVLPAREDPGS